MTDADDADFDELEKVDPDTWGKPNTEWGSFNRDPLAWIQEWNDKNGEIVICKSPITGAYAVRLHVDGEAIPISTGVAKTVAHAFKNAIDGLDAVSVVR